MTATLLKTEGEAFYLDRNSLSLDGGAVVYLRIDEVQGGSNEF